MSEYWQKQEPGKALFDDVLWSKPERRDQAGRLTIVGGNSHGFWSVASAYQMANKLGVGEVAVVMPDSLKAKLSVPVRSQLGNLAFAPSNPSGGLAIGALEYIEASTKWSGNILFIGDNGGNSETAQLLERFVSNGNYADTRVTVARDAVDMLVYGAEAVLARDNCNLVVSLGQFQKLARAVYYPRMIAFSQGVKQMAETLHKFTITYPITITLFHDSNLFVAHGGDVVSQEFDQPMRIWNGEMPTRAAAWSIWQPNFLKAVATSWVME